MRRTTLKPAVICVVTAFAMTVVFHLFFAEKPDATLDFFDVGQGDSALLSVGREQVLIDGGPDAAVLAKLGDAMPFTDRTIEAVVLTHPHADHFVGLISVLDRYRVNEIFLGGGINGTAEYRAFEEAVRRSGAKVTAVAEGDSVSLGGSAMLAVLWPPRVGDAALDVDDPNSWSVVLRVTVAGRSALLMGDAPEGIEERLTRSGEDLDTDVLKAGHHGSRFSSTAAFLRRVSPKDAIVSAGKNSYGHPTWSALERLKASGARVWRTDRDGDVRAVFDDGNVTVVASGK